MKTDADTDSLRQLRLTKLFKAVEGLVPALLPEQFLTPVNNTQLVKIKTTTNPSCNSKSKLRSFVKVEVDVLGSRP